ncbi:amidohydrolase family protein [Streptomyces sp. NPDC088116]|uniref:metal-dependent hydrolase family protein n=1 Tax=Streptomyces sp. NPDC088116 TaxID=3365825 RepID=UPI0037FA37BE
MAASPHRLVVLDAAVLDPSDGSLREGCVVVENDVIVDVADTPPRLTESEVIHARGRVVMPGLIDCHVHVLSVETDLGLSTQGSPLYLAARASRLLSDMLGRGFTTVRDVGGADYGIARAVEEGIFPGPRIVYGGPALSQTGGHGDFRGQGETCCHSLPGGPAIGRVCDGVDAVRRACREEIRNGAAHLKLMAGGGIASPTDRIDSAQFSRDEIAAAVEEADNANIYVTAHAYTAPSINRALSLGVRCIEHGNLLDQESVDLLRDNDAYLVPTLAIGQLLASAEGAGYGVTPESREKARYAVNRGMEGLALAHRGGANVAFGTDFIGSMHPHQLEEFRVRAEVLSPLDVVRSATTTAAELLRMSGRIGTVAPGARADLLIVDGNPAEDISALLDPRRRLVGIVAGGRVIKNRTDEPEAAR